ncbi:hypothetical protein NFI96_023318, partial [Prochilodus magdalenae]
MGLCKAFVFEDDGKKVAMVGTLAPFDNGNQSWEEYCEVFSHSFEANDITNAAKKHDILLSSVGSQTYSLMRNLLSPAKPGEKTYDELVELLKAHYNPKPFVMELTYDKALKLAQAIETASKDIRDIQGQSKSHGVVADKREMVYKFFAGPKARDGNRFVTDVEPGKDHGNADALSRLPLPCSEMVEDQEDRVLMMEEIALLSDGDVRKWTARDPILARVQEHIMRGWPQQ